MTNGPNRSLMARALLSDLEREVITLAPRIVRDWEGAPDYVAGPLAEFVFHLSAWERTGDGRDWDRVQQGYVEVLKAWAAAFRARLFDGVQNV